MSRVYFHTPSGDAELRGSERAWLDHVANGPAKAAWDLDDTFAFERAVEILSMIPDVPEGPNYLHTGLRKAQEQERHNKAAHASRRPGQHLGGGTSYEPQHRLVSSLRLSLAGGVKLQVRGHELHSRDVALNTALTAGSDPVRLAAKIRGWCEAHCWVEGPDREWMADVIDQGLNAGIYRRGLWYADRPGGPKDKWSPQGWDEVLALLRSRADEPLVLSYSVTDQFPSADLIAEESELEVAAWYDLSANERWRTGMEVLRERRSWARLGPDVLTSVTFGPPVTVYDLLAPDRDERVRAAFEAADISHT